MTDLIQAYKDILDVANISVTEDGFLNHQIGEMKTPVMIDGKRAVLPLPEHLKGDKTKQVFHPFTENVMRGESEVLAKYRETLDIRNSMTILMLAYELLVLATSQADHAKLSPEQSEFLSLVKDADEKTLESFKKIMDAMPASRDINKCAVYTYLKKPGTVNGVKYACVGVVSFPLYNEIVKGESVYGVKLRKKDFAPLKNIFEYILTDIETPHSFDRGSRSIVAPRLDALMQAQKAIGGSLNEKIDLFSDVLEEAKSLRYNDNWVELFDDLEVMLPKIRLIPPQAGNEGVSAKTAPEPLAPVSAPSAPTPPQQHFAPAPVQPAQSVHAPQHVPFNPYAANPYSAAPAPQQGQIRRTENGLNFADIMNSNPQTAMQFQPQQPPMQQTDWRNAPPAWGRQPGMMGGQNGYGQQQQTQPMNNGYGRPY